LGLTVLGTQEKEIAPHAADVDAQPRFPEEALRALNASGFNAVHVPEEYGGLGMGVLGAFVLAEELNRSIVPLPVVGSADH